MDRLRAHPRLAQAGVIAAVAVAGLLVYRLSAPPAEPLRWRVAGPVGATSTVVPISLEMFDCERGAVGAQMPLHLIARPEWVGAPKVDYAARAITITVPVAQEYRDWSCAEGFTRHEVSRRLEVLLREPLGSRSLLDGSTRPPREVLATVSDKR